jgi:putative restriction endonuclease
MKLVCTQHRLAVPTDQIHFFDFDSFQTSIPKLVATVFDQTTPTQRRERVAVELAAINPSFDHARIFAASFDGHVNDCIENIEHCWRERRVRHGFIKKQVLGRQKTHMSPAEQKIIKTLSKLRVDRSKGTAPHKPLLLLVIIELAKSGLLADPVLKLTPDLAFRFSVYWSIVAHRRSQPPDVRLPFHHGSTDKLWIANTADGTQSKHRDSTTSVTLTDELLTSLKCSDFRQAAGYTLIENYFEHAEQIALYELAGITPPKDSAKLDELAIQADKESRAEGRTARFRVDVVAAYCHTCALTGYRITTITGHSIVDAAHIHQFARSRNDDPQNGLALCKNAHWLFDLGLWSIDDDYRVIVAKEAFDEDCPTQDSLASMEGQQLILPRDKQLWPTKQNLHWHRTKRFVG